MQTYAASNYGKLFCCPLREVDNIWQGARNCLSYTEDACDDYAKGLFDARIAKRVRQAVDRISCLINAVFPS